MSSAPKPGLDLAGYGKQWEGRAVDGVFPLRQYLGGTPRSAVFLTGHEGRDAVIKLTHVDSAEIEAQLTRLRTVAPLSHPHLIRILGSGSCELDGTELVYIVMERADEDLSQVLPERPLTGEETQEMLKPALSALRYLHEKGFVHGALKPANIMAVDDHLKLSSDTILRAGSETSPADDVWALGAVLVECLTQHKPAFSDEAAPPLSEPFGEIAQHCLRRDPKSRWTLAEIARCLEPQPDSRATVRPAATRGATTSQSAPRNVLPRPALIPQYAPPAKSSSTPAARMILLAGVAVLIAAAYIFLRPAQSGPAATSPAPIATSASPATPAPSPPSVEPVPKAPPPTLPKAVAPEAVAPVTAMPAGKRASQSGDSAEIVSQVLPDVPQKARNTIDGKVTINVRLAVDPSGGVSTASLEPPRTSQYLSNFTLEAARRWKFQPAAPGESGAREWILRFQLRRSDTTVSASRVSP